LRSNNTFLTLVASFCLSAVAYNAAASRKVPVQHLEFDDYEINGHYYQIVMDEEVFIAQDDSHPERHRVQWCEKNPTHESCKDLKPKEEKKDEADDGDGENIDFMNANWCQIWPDHEACVNIVEGGETAGGDDEEGC